MTKKANKRLGIAEGQFHVPNTVEEWNKGMACEDKEWDSALLETLYIQGIPGLANSINESDIDELDGLKRFDISKEW